MLLLQRLNKDAEKWALLAFYVMLVMTMAVEVFRREIFCLFIDLGRRNCAVFFYLSCLDRCGRGRERPRAHQN